MNLNVHDRITGISYRILCWGGERIDHKKCFLGGVEIHVHVSSPQEICGVQHSVIMADFIIPETQQLIIVLSTLIEL